MAFRKRRSKYAKTYTEILIRDGISIQKRNSIELESIFDVKDSDIIHEYLPTNVAKPRWMLDPPVLPREMLERNDWRRTGARLRKNRWMIEGNRRDD